MTEKKLGIAEKLGYGGHHLASNMVVFFVNSYFMFYLTDVYGIPPAIAGAIFAIGVVWDGINDPLIAHFADNRRFKSGECTRPFMLYTCLPLAVSTVLLFTPFEMPLIMKVIYCIVIYIIFDTATTFYRLPGFVMPVIASADQRDRLSINAYVSGGGSLGGALATVMCWPLVIMFSKGTDSIGKLINPQRGFPVTSVIIGGILIVLALYSYFTARERIKPKLDADDKLSLFKSFKLTIQDYNFRWNTVFSTIYFICNTLMVTMVVYYSTWVLKDAATNIIIMAVFITGSITALPFVKKVSIKLGRRKAMMLGALLILAGKIPFVIFPSIAMVMYVNAFITGLSVALNIVSFSTTRAEVADNIEAVSGRRIDGMVVNFNGFFNKCGTSLTTLAIGLVLQFAGYDAGLSQQPPQVTTAIVGIMGWAAIAFAILMFFCARKITIEDVVKKLNNGDKVINA